MIRFLTFFLLGLATLMQGARAEVTVQPVNDCWVVANMLQTVDCYHVTVPLDRANPENSSARLAVAVLHSSSRNTAPDPVIYLEGGPGYSSFGTTYPYFDDYSEYWWEDSSSIRRTRDLILFDQRGMGLSRPSLDCPELHDFDRRLPEVVDYDDPLWNEEIETLGTCYDRLRAEGVPLERFDTRNSADDVADIVRALGYDEVNLYGVSYGSRLALEVMRRHPDLVRSAVLDGVYPPTVDPEIDFPGAVADAFQNLFDDCAASSGCRRVAPDVQNDFERLIADLNANPRELELYDLDYFDRGTFVRFDGSTLVMTMVEYLYDADWLPYIPLTIGTAAKGNLDALTYFYGLGSYASDGMIEGAFANIECREAPVLDTVAMAEEVARYGLYGEAAMTWSLVPSCNVWPVASNPLPDEGPVVSDIPTLLLSGRYDPVTPPSYADEAAETLSNSRHLVFRSGGHAVSFWFDCAMDATADFFVDPDPASVREPRCRSYSQPADFNVRF